jgi:hypothetical protein
MSDLATTAEVLTGAVTELPLFACLEAPCTLA